MPCTILGILECYKIAFIGSTAIAFAPVLYQDIRLEMLDVNVDGFASEERYANVSPENLDEAKALYWANMGIGWPLKAAFTFAFFGVPLVFVVWLLHYIFRRFYAARI